MTLFSNAAAVSVNAPVYFLHIPKTAGTSFQTYLTGHFGQQNICPAHLWSDLLRLTPLEVARKAFIWGHFYGYLERYISVPLRYITFLRDPVERALSHYAHITNDPSHYLYERATRLGSFEACLYDDVLTTTMKNFQVRALTMDFNPVGIAVSLTDEQLARRELERIMVTAIPSVADADALPQAIQRLDQMCFVGLTEQWDRSLQILQHTFGWEPPAVSRQRVHSGRISQHQIGSDNLAHLKAINTEDYALYEAAAERLARAV